MAYTDTVTICGYLVVKCIATVQVVVVTNLTTPHISKIFKFNPCITTTSILLKYMDDENAAFLESSASIKNKFTG